MDQFREVAYFEGRKEDLYLVGEKIMKLRGVLTVSAHFCSDSSSWEVFSRKTAEFIKKYLQNLDNLFEEKKNKLAAAAFQSA